MYQLLNNIKGRNYNKKASLLFRQAFQHDMKYYVFKYNDRNKDMSS